MFSTTTIDIYDNNKKNCTMEKKVFATLLVTYVILNIVLVVGWILSIHLMFDLSLSLLMINVLGIGITLALIKSKEAQ